MLRARVDGSAASQCGIQGAVLVLEQWKRDAIGGAGSLAGDHETADEHVGSVMGTGEHDKAADVYFPLSRAGGRVGAVYSPSCRSAVQDPLAVLT